MSIMLVFSSMCALNLRKKRKIAICCYCTAYRQVFEGCVKYFARISHVYPLFLGSYALHTDPIVRGNLVSVSVCHFEDEKTRDTKTSGR